MPVSEQPSSKLHFVERSEVKGLEPEAKRETIHLYRTNLDLAHSLPSEGLRSETEGQVKD